VTAFLAILWLRRRVRSAAWLVLLASAGTLGAGAWSGRLGPPAPVSYASDTLGWMTDGLRWRQERGASERDDTGRRGAALRRSLQTLRREELRHTAGDFERRAAAAVDLSRGLERVRSRAPAAALEVEVAVRRLALTMTAPEFRDLDARRARLEEWLGALEARIAESRDDTELAAVTRALEPGVLAAVSLRPLREDLARVDAATRALVRALSGADVSVAGGSTVLYDETRGQLVVEDRYRLAVGPPLGIVRLDAGAWPTGAAGAVARTLAYEAADGARWEIGGTGAIALPPGVDRVVIVDRRAGPVMVRPVRGLLRRLPFGRIGVEREDARGELLVGLALDQAGGPEALLPVETLPPRVERVSAPRYSLHYVSVPGSLSATAGEDVWIPAAPGDSGDPSLAVELVPPAWWLRNRIFERVRGYLYEINLTMLSMLTGLAALTGVLVRRRRPAAPAASR
jgi:hypothetical protein